MNPEIKTRWVEALRSGEYEQGRGALEFLGRFCAVGVLCHLASKEGVTSRYGENTFIAYGHTQGYVGTAPPEVVTWSGIKDGNASFDVLAGEEDTVTGLNDMSLASFTEIADVIEEKL